MSDTKFGSIEKGIPLPKGSYGNKTGITSKLRELMAAEVGDSILITGSTNMIVANLANQAGGKGWYTVRSMIDGVRIWKKAEPIKKEEEKTDDA